MGWYSQGTQVFDFTENADGTITFHEAGWFTPENANTWVSHVFKAQRNQRRDVHVLGRDERRHPARRRARRDRHLQGHAAAGARSRSAGRQPGTPEFPLSADRGRRERARVGDGVRDVRRRSSASAVARRGARRCAFDFSRRGTARVDRRPVPRSRAGGRLGERRVKRFARGRARSRWNGRGRGDARRLLRTRGSRRETPDAATPTCGASRSCGAAGAGACGRRSTAAQACALVEAFKLIAPGVRRAPRARPLGICVPPQPAGRRDRRGAAARTSLQRFARRCYPAGRTIRLRLAGGTRRPARRRARDRPRATRPGRARRRSDADRADGCSAPRRRAARRARERGLGQRRVAEQERRRPRRDGRARGVQRLDGDAALARGRRLTRASSTSPGSYATTCRPAATPPTRDLGQVLGERGDERVAARAVAAARAAQVAVDLAAREQVGERGLVEDRRAAVGAVLLVGEVAARASSGTTSQPEPQRRRERLARRARVDARGRARGPAARRPGRGRSGTRRRSRPRRRAASCSRAHATSAARRSGASTTPVGNWCAGETTTASTSPRARRRRCPSLVDRDGHRLEARACSIAAPLPAPARVLDRDPPGAVPAQRPPQRPGSPWYRPPHTTTRSGSASTPRVRPRCAASASRSGAYPRGSP